MRIFALFLVLTLVQVSLVLANDLPKVQQEIIKEERTLSIIKPDAVAANHIGDIISRFEKQGLHIVEMKMMRLDQQKAASFYEIHKERPFYQGLVDFMVSGPVVVMVLEGHNAVAKNREIMGATDPSKASKGTLRADFATSVQKNAVHGSDSLENAQNEILFFFPESR